MEALPHDTVLIRFSSNNLYLDIKNASFISRKSQLVLKAEEKLIENLRVRVKEHVCTKTVGPNHNGTMFCGTASVVRLKYKISIVTLYSNKSKSLFTIIYTLLNSSMHQNTNPFLGRPIVITYHILCYLHTVNEDNQ